MRTVLTERIGRASRLVLLAGLTCSAGVASLATAAPVSDLLPEVSDAASTVLDRPEIAVGHPVVSKAFRDIVPQIPAVNIEREKAIGRLPPPKDSPIVRFDNRRGTSGSGTSGGSVGPLVATTAGLNFAGLGQGDYGFNVQYAPPDTVGAVGATQYVQWVNVSLAVYSKTNGALVSGPIAGNQLFASLGGPCSTTNDGDPIVQYDKAAARWVLTQFTASAPYTQCVAVSQTSDATGAYNLYAFPLPTNSFGDYPKLGVWPDAYYITFNIFNGNTFGGARACAYDRAKMIAGTTATQICFQTSTSYGGLLPSDLDGTTAPPAGSPNYFVNYGTSRLNVWKFHVDFATPANSTFTGPTAVSTAAFTAACGGGTCVQQSGTTNKLDSLADRIMYRAAYRNRAGTESLLINQSVKVSGTSTKQVVGVRWYELRIASQTPSLYQQGTFSPDSTSRWMGSLAMDKVGNIALGYSASSTSVFPSIRYTGRAPGDALGTMQAENTIISGSGSQTGTLHRWGDYSAMTVDPVDDCTFWYTTEYGSSNGSFNWKTRIASFKFPTCQ